MASDIAVALISGVVGLTTGAIGSLFAPWANWGVEKARLRRESRVKRVLEWRTGVALLLKAEREDGIEQRVAKSLHEQGSITGQVQYDTFVPDPDLANVQTKGWFRTLKRELPSPTISAINQLAAQEIFERAQNLPDVIDSAIDSIERDEWKLV